VRAYAHTYGLPATVTNCSNNYGPYQHPEKLIPHMVLNGMEGKPLPLYGDGQQVRDWLYVQDHAEAVWLVLRKGTPGQTYNVGGAGEYPNEEVVRRVCALLDEMAPDCLGRRRLSLVEYVADRPGHDRRYAMDAAKISRELGWHPRHLLDAGLRETVQWYLDHPAWVKAARDKPSYQAWLDQNYSERSRSL
jgi:dTDP-glucose 4,6-dehydratase